MRSRVFLLIASLLVSVLTACGQPASTDQAVAQASSAATALVSAATPEPTSVRPTATPEPTSVPPTVTPEPTIVPPTATPEPVPSPQPTAVPAQTVAPEVVADDVNDVPQLGEQAAAPVADQPVAAVKPSQPVRLVIPAIKLNYKPVSVGLDKRNVPIVPKHDVGWYNLSAMPGQGDNVVFWGHVLRFKATPNIAAPFARVKELKPGALVIVTTASGEEVQYKVTKSVQVTPDQVKYILPTGKEQVTLVSCIGDNVIAGGEVTKKFRLVTIADRVK